ncbi:G protein-activated inward rectifier potassium channel 3-like [Latimeria chalumnae]|uniref:G protein-activated inward rectifier potassium channel 3-like n=1 Tax=Latimeria chalumnae TaxID=7897 RepID=UPI00313BFCD7
MTLGPVENTIPGSPSCSRGKLSHLSSLNSILSVEWLHPRHSRALRLISKNGRCNIQYKENTGQMKIRRLSLQDPFNTFMDMSWPYFLLTFALVFAGSWMVFGLIWWNIAYWHSDTTRHLENSSSNATRVPCVTSVYSFSSAFLFSIETQTTIGYGVRSITSECREGILLLVFQALVGLIIDCTMLSSDDGGQMKTLSICCQWSNSHQVFDQNSLAKAHLVGLLYTKISRPKNRSRMVLFSKMATVTLRNGKLCLMYQIGDLRNNNKIVGAKMSTKFIKMDSTQEDEVIAFHQTDMAVYVDESGDVPFLPSPFCITVCHEINEKSPLYQLSAKNIKHEKFEIVTVFEGTFETTGQAFQIRSSYLPKEIKWGHRFVPMLSQSISVSGFEIDFTRFNKTVEVATPLCSSKKLRSLSWSTEASTGGESIEEEERSCRGQSRPYWLQVQVDETLF